MKTTNPGFSRSFAKQHGVTEAIIIRYLANRISKSKNIREGKKWFYNPISELALHWPYFSRTTVAETLKRLEKAELIEVGCFNKWKQDRTRWYSAPQTVLDAAEEDVVHFDSAIASTHGICAGAVMLNIRYLLQKKKGKKAHFSPTGYSEVMPFSVSTIKRALAKLIGDQLLAKAENKPDYIEMPTPKPFVPEGASVEEILKKLKS